MAAEKILRLVLGDQLNLRHTWFQKPRSDVVYAMMEVRQETDYVRHHIQKVAGFFAAMRRFAAEIEGLGHRVRYLRLDDPENAQNIEENLRAMIRQERYTRFEYLLPDEYRLDRQLAADASRLPVPSAAADTEHFLTERDAVARMFAGKKRFLMESFYRQMRRRHDILLENGKPAGGKWNYDSGNRSRYDGAVPIPAAMEFESDVTDIVEMIERCGVTTLGRIDPKRFIWPVTRSRALAQLDEFVRLRLPHFGTYQDAMTTRSGSLFHSRLSFALNTKMLHPMEVIRAAVGRAEQASGPAIGIGQLEGFVRQILGWREFMRGVYWAKMPSYETLNHFDHHAPLPGYYWTGDTRMACMRAAIAQSLEQAYAHHIQRLMVTGNFALLAGVHPDAVDAWYLGVYIDAVQWVEIVNTRGMSQFADGGIVATKPYVSSANYIRKMSDYCDGCRYTPAKGAGEGACPFNSLYWDFLHRHRARLEKNPRVAMMYRTWDRMKPDTRDDLLTQARAYRSRLDDL
ncbi:cryptochrome/photolyase family protein [Desulfococcus sp.]|uniref:cryptochrome/photolyase family protein n=1 Tax=Desulfococcus sp. TaxID=2025834 RepID=UPI0035931908